MGAQKTIGFVFVEKFADWEYGLLAASATEWFGAKAVALSPGGEPVKGTSGFRLTTDRGTEAIENADLDAVAVIGSDTWVGDNPPDVSALLKAVAGRGGVVGGICAGTLTLARAGLFEGAKHTSNGADWIAENAPGYAGSSSYVDVAQAVADGRIVSAPGSAPGTFAVRFLEALYPGQEDQFAEMRAMFAKEYAEAS